MWRQDAIRFEESGLSGTGETGRMWILVGTAFILALLLTFAWMTK
jgi:hypothetical protein